MKKKALVAAVLAATTLTATSAFAAQNPFKDVPSDHWAYDAIAMLAEDGILEGYGDGTFNGTKAMNRYEMAEIVSKVVAKYDTARPADKGAIKKLEKEFSKELKDMDVRLSQLESDVAGLKGGMKWYGDARLRYFENKMMKLHDKSSTTKGSQFEKRVRLGIYAEPAENLSVDGRLKYEDSSLKKDGWGGNRQNNWGGSLDNQNSFRLDKFSLNWNHADTKISAGRTEVSLGQGLLYWENQVDGLYVEHKFGPHITAMAGWGDISAAGWQDSNVGSFFANLKVQTSPATQITAAWLHTNDTLQKAGTSTNYSYVYTDNTGVTKLVASDSSKVWTDASGKKYAWDDATNANYEVSDSGKIATGTSTTWTKDDYKLNQVAVGFNSQLAPKWNIIAEGVRNNAGVLKHKNGLWTRLTYGKQVWNQANTWHVYGEYFALGGGSIDSQYWAHRLNIAGGNAADAGFASDAGARGWGIGVGYMLAKNTNLELTYYMLKPYDKNAAGFDNYNNTGYAALTYSF